MSNLNKFYTELVGLLTTQTISSVEWNDSKNIPIYLLGNGDKISLRIGVSTSDYDLFCNYTHNEQKVLYYIEYSDTVGTPLDKINEGVSIDSPNVLAECTSTTINNIQMVGSGQEAYLRLKLSNNSHIVYSTSYGSPKCSVSFHTSSMV